MGGGGNSKLALLFILPAPLFDVSFELRTSIEKLPEPHSDKGYEFSRYFFVNVLVNVHEDLSLRFFEYFRP